MHLALASTLLVKLRSLRPVLSRPLLAKLRRALAHTLFAKMRTP